MRTLNDREKTFIKDMLEATSSGRAITINQVLTECFFTREKETALVLLEKNNLIGFYTPYDTSDNKKQQLFLEYMEIYELIRYLLEMKYIYKHRVWDLKDKLRIISKKSDTTEHSIEKTCNLVINKQGDYLENILSPNLWEWKNASGVTIYQGEQLYPEDEKEIFSICSSVIYITEELREYVKNGFCTPEDIKFKESQLLAWIAIIISIMLGLAGIALNIIQIILSKIQ